MRPSTLYTITQEGAPSTLLNGHTEVHIDRCLLDITSTVAQRRMTIAACCLLTKNRFSYFPP